MLSSSSPLQWLDLPDDVWRHIATHSTAPDLLQFLSSHRRFHYELGHSPAFWKFLLDRQDGASMLSSSLSSSSRTPRQEYMMRAYQRHLPVVQWLPRLHRSTISPREGHLACVFSQTSGEEWVCITGGFTDDDTIYLLPDVTQLDGDGDVSGGGGHWPWVGVTPTGPRTFVYGSSLTPLDSHRAIRVGGFQSGGYSAETNQVTVLTITELPSTSETSAGSGAGLRRRFSAHWQTIAAQNPHFCVARAYHTATLLQGRYLVIVGGMTSRGCIVQESILDTQTWTWLDPTIITAMSASLGTEQPSGRHGHSVVLDEKRNRLVLFGGGSGTDLLRSGEDNSEVWEWRFGKGWNTDLEASFPWTWRKIHADTPVIPVENPGGGGEEEEAPRGQQPSPLLSPAETLCLGRCHQGLKVSPDSALLLFGSARPSSNGILGYDLQLDQFLRPKIRGPLPVPRFTFASVMVPSQGYLIIHGGYASQEGDAISQMTALDLAPLQPTTPSRVFPSVDPDFQSYEAVTDGQALVGRRRRSVPFFHQFWDTLVDNEEGEGHRGVPADMLGNLMDALYGGRSVRPMNMLANGGTAAVQWRGMDDEEEHDDDDDSEYQQQEEDKESDDDAMGGL